MLDLIIGKRELGKTTLALSIAGSFETRVIFDPRHMIETTSDILNERTISGNLYEMLEMRSEVIVRPYFDVETCFSLMCDEIYDWLQDNSGKRFCLVIDECRFVKEPEKNPKFDFIVRCTNRSRVTVIMTCHGIVDVSPDLRRVADYWIMFRLTMEADIDRVRERCGDDVAEAVQKLGPYQYIVWNDANATWKAHLDSTKWFVPMKTPIISPRMEMSYVNA
jgi:hypothetical protein